jgi:cytoskeletal protein CcmA (bactofilin family)
MKDLAQSGSQFSYKVACTKPQKIDGAVKGSVTATGMTMDMTMEMAGMAGTVTQSITARRLGDCK